MCPSLALMSEELYAAVSSGATLEGGTEVQPSWLPGKEDPLFLELTRGGGIGRYPPTPPTRTVRGFRKVASGPKDL